MFICFAGMVSLQFVYCACCLKKNSIPQLCLLVILMVTLWDRLHSQGGDHYTSTQLGKVSVAVLEVTSLLLHKVLLFLLNDRLVRQWLSNSILGMEEESHI